MDYRIWGLCGGSVWLPKSRQTCRTISLNLNAACWAFQLLKNGLQKLSGA